MKSSLILFAFLFIGLPTVASAGDEGSEVIAEHLEPAVPIERIEMPAQAHGEHLKICSERASKWYLENLKKIGVEDVKDSDTDLIIQKAYKYSYHACIDAMDDDNLTNSEIDAIIKNSAKKSLIEVTSIGA